MVFYFSAVTQSFSSFFDAMIRLPGTNSMCFYLVVAGHVNSLALVEVKSVGVGRGGISPKPSRW